MTGSTVRRFSAVAALAAAAVIVAHLVLEWTRHDDPATRQAIAFDHGLAAAVVLALALAAARLALALDGEIDHPVADAVAIAGCVATLADMAAFWRDRGMSIENLGTVAVHLAVIAAVFGVRALVVRVEGPRWRAHRRPAAPRPSTT